MLPERITAVGYVLNFILIAIFFTLEVLTGTIHFKCWISLYSFKALLIFGAMQGVVSPVVFNIRGFIFVSIFSIVLTGANHATLCCVKSQRFAGIFIFMPVFAPLAQVVPFVQLDIAASSLQAPARFCSFAVSDCSFDFCTAMWTIKKTDCFSHPCCLFDDPY